MWRLVRFGSFGVLAALVSMVALGSSADAQADSARIEIEFTQATDLHDVTLYQVETFGTGLVELRRESGVVGRWATELPPGCYAVRLERTSGVPGAWLDPIAKQPAFCLDAGEVASRQTGATTRLTAGRDIVNGEVVDPDGNPVPGVTVDFFEVPAGLSAAEVRLLDHRIADHRGPFEFARTTAVDGTWRFNDVRARCFIQTLTAPDGFIWADGRRYVNRSACSSEYATLTAYPVGRSAPPDGFLRIEMPASADVTSVQVSVDHAEDGDPRPETHWSRTSVPLATLLRVPAGCHVVRFDIGNTQTFWTAASSATQEVPVCVTSSDTVVVAPRPGTRVLDHDPDRPFIAGGFSRRDTPQGEEFVAGVQVDVYYPIDGITDAELRTVDHTEADYRGDFFGSVESGSDGIWHAPAYARCFVTTMIAPDGLEFVITGDRFLQRTTCQDDNLVLPTLRAVDGEALFGGQITTERGFGVEGISVDVFAPVDGISDEELRAVDHTTVDYRAEYLETVVSDDNGRFGFQRDARCLILTYIGNEQVQFATGQYFRQTICPGETVNAVVRQDVSTDSDIGGVVRGSVPVRVDLFEANADGTRGRWLDDITTTVSGDVGLYSFDVSPGCYVTVLIAPEGFVFAATGSPWQQMPACPEPRESVANPKGELLPV